MLGVIKSAALTGCNIHIIPIAIIHNHRLKNESISIATSIKPNTTISMKALGFAIPASANNIHDKTIYLKVSLLNSDFHTLLKNTTHINIAKIVNAITHRSVLLSTNTKNAHIQLVSHSKRVDHHIPNTTFFVVSDNSFFSEKYHIISCINHKPNIKHRGHVKKFIATAIVSGANRSGANQPSENIDQILNQNVINIYHRYGIADASHIFHRNNP